MKFLTAILNFPIGKLPPVSLAMGAIYFDEPRPQLRPTHAGNIAR